MPLNLNTPVTTVLDQVRGEQFTVSPQNNTVMIHYSRGFEENGQYIPKEYAAANFENVTFDQNLYESVKAALYDLLGSQLNGA